MPYRIKTNKNEHTVYAESKADALEVFWHAMSWFNGTPESVKIISCERM